MASNQNCIIHMKSGRSFSVKGDYESVADILKNRVEGGIEERVFEFSEAKGANPLHVTLDFAQVEAVGQLQ